MAENSKIIQWKPTSLDLGLSVGIAILLPLVAQFVYNATGALIPMLIYYAIAWGIVKWRRGSSGYFNPIPKKIPVVFFLNIGIILLCILFAYLSPIIHPEFNLSGFLFTALIWAPINAATEQLLWIYIFEAWDLYPKKTNLAFRGIGLLVFSMFVGLIHTMFWVQFLHTVDSSNLIGVIFVILTTISGILHLVVWRKTNQMVFTFIPHFLLNLIPLFWTNYSMIPYLFF